MKDTSTPGLFTRIWSPRTKRFCSVWSHVTKYSQIMHCQNAKQFNTKMDIFCCVRIGTNHEVECSDPVTVTNSPNTWPSASDLVNLSQLLGLNRPNTPLHDWFLKPK